VRGLQERWPVTALTDESALVVASGEDRPGPRRLLVALAVSVVVVLADQLTKWWAVTRLSTGPIHVIGTLDLELSRNTGVSFSLFQGKDFILIPIGLALVGWLLVMAWRSPSAGRAALLGLIRDDHGAVVDFIALHCWPTFNVADSCIVVGCVLLLVSLARGPRTR
jgi:signal peptidase II